MTRPAVSSGILTIDRWNGIPMHAQLIDRMKRAIMFGARAPEEQLPTVRALAADLAINPDSIGRVYQELKSERLRVTFSL